MSDSAESAAPPQTEEPELPLPPPTIEFLVASLKMQAEAHLGLLDFGDEKENQPPNLRLARHAIDMLAMLGEKTRGNLGVQEQLFLENSLTELRFRYVQASERPPRS